MEKNMASRVVQSAAQAVPLLLKFPERRFWVDYDAGADLLHISFRRSEQEPTVMRQRQDLIAL